MEAGWRTGFCPWSEADGVEGLSAQIVHWRIWAVGLTGAAERTVTQVCVEERVVWRRLIMTSPDEPEG